MENKDLHGEIEKIKVMVKKKLAEYGNFCTFGVAYHAGGNTLAQVEEGLPVAEYWVALDKMVGWLRNQNPDMAVVGLQTKEIGCVGGREPSIENGILIVAMTRTATINLYITFTKQDGQYVFSEEVTTDLDSRVSVALSKVFGTGETA